MRSNPIDLATHYLEQHEKPRQLTSLAVFRILFFLHVLLCAYYTHVYKGLIFDSIAGVTKNVFPFNTFLSIWAISATLMVFGLASRYASVINYLCVIIAYQLYNRAGIISYYDDLLLMGSFLAIFLPVSKAYSLDSLTRRVVTGSHQPVYTSNLVYISAVILSLGVMYFGSGLTKLVSPVWQNGLGLWIPLSIPLFTWNTLATHVADWEWTVKGVNYLIVLWETLFLLLLCNKHTRRVAIVLGILFHAGIGIFFYFPKTAIGSLFFYALFIPDSFWTTVSSKLRSSKKINVYLPPQQITSIRAWAFLSGIDFRNKFSLTSTPEADTVILADSKAFIRLLGSYSLYKPIAYFLQTGAYRGILHFIQQALPAQLSHDNREFISPVFKRRLLIQFTLLILVLQLTVSGVYVAKHLLKPQSSTTLTTGNEEQPVTKLASPSWMVRSLWGINSRGVFLDKAIAKHKRTYAIICEDSLGCKKWLPFVHETGLICTDLNLSGNWTKPLMHFLSTPRGLSSNGLEKVIIYWGTKQAEPIKKFRYTLLTREYPNPTHFEKGYWLKLQHLQWDTVGTAGWEKDTFRFVPTHGLPFSAK